MISLASGLPLLQIGDRGVSEYSSEWLETSIYKAAEQAGHSEWWFAQDIVKSLFLYLKERFQSSVITVNQLFEKLRLTLTALGFQDIAKHLHDEVPPYKISLLQIANEASVSGSYELCFFKRLGSSLDEALATGTELIHAHGIKLAVRKLCGARRWGPACVRMQQEILAFVEERAGGKASLTLRIV